MLTDSNRLLVISILREVIAGRSTDSDDQTITVDHASSDAISALITVLQNVQVLEPAIVELILTSALELLHEMPKPCSRGVLLAELWRRAGVDP